MASILILAFPSLIMDITDKILKEQQDVRTLTRHLHKSRVEQELESIQDEILGYDANILAYDDDSDDIDFDIREIQRQTYGYVFIGLRLKRLFLTKRYLQKFSNVGEFCKQVLGRSLAYAKRLIKAAEVAVELARAGFSQLPLCEAQARPLYKLEMWPNALNPEESPLCQKWAEILESSHEPITAEMVVSAVDGDKPQKKQTIKTNPQTWEKLERMRLERGFADMDEMLEAFVSGELEPPAKESEPTTPEPEEVPPAPAEIQVSWMEKVRDRFLTAYPHLMEVKAVINEYLNFVWLQLQPQSVYE